jgi:hypothetical protein
VDTTKKKRQPREVKGILGNGEERRGETVKG